MDTSRFRYSSSILEIVAFMSLEEPNGCRVLITDDHPIFREGLKNLLQRGPHHVFEAQNGNEALSILANEIVDIVLMDIRLPGMNGIETTRMIKSEYPKTQVLALSMHEEEHFFLEMMQAGASGYLVKTVGKNELMLAIESVVKGDTYFSSDISAPLLARYLAATENGNLSQSLKAAITPREKEILKLICSELTNSEIADQLNISRRTVDTHRKNLLRKLGARNTVGMVRYAIRSGLLELEGN